MLHRNFKQFEKIVRKSPQKEKTELVEPYQEHPFDIHNVHPKLPKKVKKLFDDGHFADSTFNACKFLEKEIKRLANIRGKTGHALMMDVFQENNPKIQLNDLANDSEKDEQLGYRYIFAGTMSAIRNPRGHDEINDDPDTCIDHLTFISMLIRKIESAGHEFS